MLQSGPFGAELVFLIDQDPERAGYDVFDPVGDPFDDPTDVLEELVPYALPEKPLIAVMRCRSAEFRSALEQCRDARRQMSNSRCPAG